MEPGGLASPAEPESPVEPVALGVSEVEEREVETVVMRRACLGSVVEALGEAWKDCSESLDCGHADELAAQAIGSW